MHTEKVDAQDLVGASALLGAGLSEQLSVTGRYDVKCLDADGNLKWEENFKNIVVNTGKIDLLTQYFKGSSYSATFFLGLVNNASFTTYAPGDTLLSHGGWLESTAYSGTRPSVTFGAASASGGSSNPGVAGTGSLTTSSAVTFTMNATVTILGAFLCTVTSGTSGTLYSAGSFATARAVISGDQLLVTYTAQS
jgi:hypothetical protein